MNQLKKNFLYNSSYQILKLIIPLITEPYLARVLGLEGVGTYSYTYSIVYYFMLATLLGVNDYGNRSIARVRDNKEKLSKTFWEIYIFQLILGIVMLVSYFIYISIFSSDYRRIFLIQSLFILSAILDINWFYFGLEKFKTTIGRNIIIKVLTVFLIFIFVKNTSDIYIYTFIMSIMTVISQLALWGFLKRDIHFVKVSKKDIQKHIKPNLTLFLPVISVSLYKIMDKIMLGILSNITEVGYYESAEKIINVPLALISALGTVMLPRISNMLVTGDEKMATSYISKSISFIMFLSFAMCFGIISVSYEFAPIYFGPQFKKTGILMIYLSITIPFCSFANVLRTQYLIPKARDKDYLIASIIGAIINIVLNLILIPSMKSIGAGIATIFAEFFVMLYQIIAVRKDLPIKDYVKSVIPFLLKSIIMFILIIIIKCFRFTPIITILLQVIIGILIYIILNWKFINSMIDIKIVLKKYFKV